MTSATRRSAPVTGRGRSRRGAVLAVMCAGMFLVQLDVTVVNVALPHLGADLRAGVAGLQWVVTGYAVVLAALLLTGGVLGDRRGHRRVVVTGLVVFGTASLACGLAPATWALVGARMVQGVGAALLLPGTLAIVAQAFPDPGERARALGVWTGTAALALPAGPLIGGLLITGVGWRSVFVVNVPIVVLALAGTLRWCPPDERPEGAPASRRADLPGAVTAAVALGAVVYAAIGAGGGHGAAAVAACVVAVAALCGFAAVEWRTAAHGGAPMLPLCLLRVRAFTGANAVAGAMNLVGIGMNFVVGLYLQEVLHMSPLRTGLGMLPMFAPLALLAPVTGRITARLGPRRPMIAGLLTGAAGMLSLQLMPDRTSYVATLPLLLGLGVGMGLLTAAVVTAAMSAVPGHRSGLAGGVNNTARQACGAVGVAAFGAVAGDPGDGPAFVTGLHVTATAGSVLWLAAAVVTVWAMRPPHR